jgi:hypothetical protein
MDWIIGIDDGRVKTLSISAGRYKIVGPAYASIG